MTWFRTLGPDYRARSALLLALLLPWSYLYWRAGIEISTALIGILFLADSAIRRDWQWTRQPVIRVALVAWVFLMLVVSPFAIHPKISFLSALPWVRYILLFAALRYWLLTHRPAFQAMGATLAVLVVFCSVETCWQYVTGFSFFHHPIAESGRLTGPLTGPRIGIFLARFLLPAAAVMALLSSHKPRAMVLVAIGTLFCLGAILLTGERTAFALSALACMGVVLLVALRAPRVRRYALGVMLLLAAGTFVLVQTQPWVKFTLQRSVQHIEHFSETPYARIFTVAYETGREHWLTGAGIQGVRAVTQEKQLGVVNPNGSADMFLHAHNPYLEWFAEAGLGGLLLFVGIVSCLVWEAFQWLRRARGIQVMVPGFMLGACLLDFFPLMSSQSYFSNWAGIMVWYALGVIYATPALLEQEGKTGR